MAKISELEDKDLQPALKKYSKRLKEDPSDERSKKIVKRIKKEIIKRGLESSENEKTRTIFNKSISQSISFPFKIPGSSEEGEVEKFHTDHADYSDYEDASFGNRFLAVVFDMILLGVATNVISLILGFIFKDSILGILAFFVSYMITPFTYYYLTMKNTGQTLGKKVLKIRVVKKSGGVDFEVSDILKREIFGKFISGVIFGVGFLIRLSGAETWHDGLADTKVVKAE